MKPKGARPNRPQVYDLNRGNTEEAFVWLFFMV
jgi:hypothetical protein